MAVLWKESTGGLKLVSAKFIVKGGGYGARWLLGYVLCTVLHSRKRETPPKKEELKVKFDCQCMCLFSL
jgi:hypothetical protein